MRRKSRLYVVLPPEARTTPNHLEDQKLPRYDSHDAKRSITAGTRRILCLRRLPTLITWNIGKKKVCTSHVWKQALPVQRLTERVMRMLRTTKEFGPMVCNHVVSIDEEGRASIHRFNVESFQSQQRNRNWLLPRDTAPLNRPSNALDHASLGVLEYMMPKIYDQRPSIRFHR